MKRADNTRVKNIQSHHHLNTHALPTPWGHALPTTWGGRPRHTSNAKRVESMRHRNEIKLVRGMSLRGMSLQVVVAEID